jgi:hypothetical protein
MSLSRQALSKVCLLAAGALLLAAPAAQADVITFVGPEAVIPPGAPTVEGIFRYDAISGGLLRSSIRGRPRPDIEGRAASNGGGMRVVRNDVSNGLFRFDSAEIARFNYSLPQFVTFEGFRGGVLQGTDIFGTSATNGVFLSVVPLNLNGAFLDELRVTLPAATQTTRWTALDNLTLTAISAPEPGTLGLLALTGLPLVGAVVRRRRRSA